MENAIEEIKRRIDIIDFIGSYVQLKKTGRNFKSPCPFHQEKTASFVVSPERQIWHCFGQCGDGGDIIKFLMKWENITFFEALKELAQKANVKLEKVNFEDKEWNTKDRLLKANNLAAEFYEYIFTEAPFAQNARDYVESRHVNPKLAKTFTLGYSPNSWDSLLKFMKKKKFEEEELLQAGLLVKTDAGRYYDRFRGRLIFPIKDIRGVIIGFSGRILDKTADSAKYVNTPETPIYHKRESLFGIHLAKDAIKKEGSVLLVEGEFDMITPYQHGIENIVAIKGSAVTREQLAILKRLTNKIILSLDSDVAGIEAIKRGIEEAEKQECDISVIQYPNGKDPDEAVRNDLIGFKKALKSPVPIYDFILDVTKLKYPKDDPFDKKRIGEEVIPHIANIQNPIVRSYYVKKLAGVLDVSEDSIDQLMRRSKNNKRSTTRFIPKQHQTKQVNREDMIQKYILSCLLQSENPYEMYQQFVSILKPQDFSILPYQQLLEEFDTFKNKNTIFNIESFISQLPAELKPTADELFLYELAEIESGKENIERLLKEIKQFASKRSLSSLLIKEETETNPENEVNEVEKKINAV